MSVRARHFLRLNQLTLAAHCINLVNKDQAWCTFAPARTCHAHVLLPHQQTFRRKSDPLMLKKCFSFTSNCWRERVLPVPGGPTINTPGDCSTDFTKSFRIF